MSALSPDAAAGPDQQPDEPHMSLNPQVLRDAADLLTPLLDEDGEEFMCHAVKEAGGCEGEFGALLELHGVSTGGSLSHRSGSGRWLRSLYKQKGSHTIGASGRLSGYRPGDVSPTKRTQSVRFMFLEFLALEMESRA